MLTENKLAIGELVLPPKIPCKESKDHSSRDLLKAGLFGNQYGTKTLLDRPKTFADKLKISPSNSRASNSKS